MQYHVEMRYEAGNEPNRWCSIKLFNMHDTNVTVSCIDDPLLLYSLDIGLYEPGRIGHDFILETSQTNLYLNDYEGYDLHDPPILYRMKSVSVILGSATNYTVSVTGGYLNSSISLGEGTAVNLNTFFYLANGTLKLHLGNNITYYEPSDPGRFYIDISDNQDTYHSFYDLESAQITIDLPRPWECRIWGGWHEWTTTENIGWIPINPHNGVIWSIATPGYDNGSSRINFELYARRVNASLFYWNHSG